MLKKPINKGTFDDFGAPLKNANGDVIKKDGKIQRIGAFPEKSWAAYATVFATIISVSISFPLYMRILTGVGEEMIPALRKNVFVRYGFLRFLHLFIFLKFDLKN